MTIIEEYFSDSVAVFGNILEILVAIIATFTWKKYKNSPVGFLFFYLWATVLVDFILVNIVYHYFEYHVGWLYNIYYFFCFYFILNWLYKILKVNLIKYLSYGLILVFILNFFITNFIEKSFIFNYIFGAISILIASTFYYINLLKSNDIFNLKNNLSFWITTGFLLFYIGMIPLKLLPYISNIGYRNNYSDVILIILNLILYGCFMAGLLLTKKTTWKKEI